MPQNNLYLTRLESVVTLDTLVFLSAYSREEMRDHLDWGGREVRAWSSALRKLDDLAVSLRSN